VNPTEVINDSMRHLHERLKPFGKFRAPLIVNVLVVEEDRRLFGGFTNVRRNGSLKPTFGYVVWNPASVRVATAVVTSDSMTTRSTS
jgi:hypothetical protein